MRSEDLLPIGELARRTGVNPVTLRAWERRYGLLKPQRTAKGHRLYPLEQVERVEAVLAWLGQARAAGTRVLIGDPGRTYFPRSGLDFLAEYRVPTTRELEDQEIKRAAVWALP